MYEMLQITYKQMTNENVLSILIKKEKKMYFDTVLSISFHLRLLPTAIKWK